MRCGNDPRAKGPTKTDSRGIRTRGRGPKEGLGRVDIPAQCGTTAGRGKNRVKGGKGPPNVTGYGRHTADGTQISALLSTFRSLAAHVHSAISMRHSARSE